jgi:hypothetical protein
VNTIEVIDGICFVNGEPASEEQAQAAAHENAVELSTASDAAALVTRSARASLDAALALLESGPLDDSGRAQVDAALTQYRALPPAPPADVVDLANRVSTHIQSNSYASMVAARNAHMVAEMTFVSDPTISHAQLVAHVRELTRQVWALRSGA